MPAKSSIKSTKVTSPVTSDPAPTPAVKLVAKTTKATKVAKGAKTAAKSATKSKTTVKKSSAKKTATPVVVAAPVVAAPVVVVAAPVVEVASEVEVCPQLLVDQQFQALTEKLVALRTMEASLMSELKALHKSTLKHIKMMSKKKKRTPGDKKNRTPSGFAKPTKMSVELCKFLSEPEGTEMARTEVTKYITKYVKEHDLQNPENRREIKCDASLKALLSVDDTVTVTYFNLQKYMKVHFVKAEPVVVV